MRRESNNQFSDGLINDLNPINTPNTILTDNLNGTIITYNGNEYSLQNDMGNYKLEYCKLQRDYVPVGIREYADILYIVSYNPLTEHVEIGSYPSPERIFGNEGKKGNESGDMKISSLFDDPINKNYDYSDIIKNSKLHIFYDGDEGSLFLNPGDEYKLDFTNNNLINIEQLKYFIIDENKRTYDVTWAINKEEEKNDFTKVKWDVPGWLAIKVDVGNFEEFDVNIRKFTIPTIASKGFSSTIELNFQLKIKDDLFRKNDIDLIKKYGHLSLSITNQHEDNIISTLTYLDEDIDSNGKVTLKNMSHNVTLNENKCDIPLKHARSLSWYPDASILYFNVTIKTVEELNKTDTITIYSVPKINISRLDKNENADRSINETTDEPTDASTTIYSLIYDNFEFKQNIQLNSIGDMSKINFGTDLFKFWVNNDDEDKPKSLVIEYNLNGPFIPSSDINLYYAIWDIQKYNKPTVITQYELVPNFNGIGQNLTKIPFNDKFQPESYYVIEFALAENKPIQLNTIDRTLLKLNDYNSGLYNNVYRSFRTVITSKVINEINDHRVYDFELTLNDIVECLFKTWDKEQLDLTIDLENSKNVREYDTTYDIPNYIMELENYIRNNNYKLNVVNLVVDKLSQISIKNGIKSTINWQYEGPKKLDGPLWTELKLNEDIVKSVDDIIVNDEYKVFNGHVLKGNIRSNGSNLWFGDPKYETTFGELVFNKKQGTENIEFKNLITISLQGNVKDGQCIKLTVDNNSTLNKTVCGHKIESLQIEKIPEFQNNFITILKVQMSKTADIGIVERGCVLDDNEHTYWDLINARFDSTANSWFIAIKQRIISHTYPDAMLIPFNGFSGSNCGSDLIDNTDEKAIEHLSLLSNVKFIVKPYEKSKKIYQLVNFDDYTILDTHKYTIQSTYSVKEYNIVHNNISQDLTDLYIKTTLFNKENIADLKWSKTLNKSYTKELNLDAFPNILDLNNNDLKSTTELQTKLTNFSKNCLNAYDEYINNPIYKEIVQNNGNYGVYGNINSSFKTFIYEIIRKNPIVDVDDMTIQKYLNQLIIGSRQNSFRFRLTANYQGVCNRMIDEIKKGNWFKVREDGQRREVRLGFLRKDLAI